jgi:hypothetical protein
MNVIIAEAASKKYSDSRSPGAPLHNRGFDVWSNDVQQKGSHTAIQRERNKIEGPQCIEPLDLTRTSSSPWRVQASRAPIQPTDLSIGPSASASPTRVPSANFTTSQETVVHKQASQLTEPPLPKAAKHPSSPSHQPSTRPELGPIFTPSRQDPSSAGPSSMRRVS